MAGGVAAAGTLYSVGKSISQSHQANEIDKSNPRPTYSIPPEFYQNLNIANQLAVQGLPQQVLNQQKEAIDQNQAAAISAAQRSANPGAAISGIVGQGNQASSQLQAQNADAQRQNLMLAMSMRGQLAQQKLAAQQYNLFDKYTEQFNKAASLRTAANANLENGVNGLSGIAGSLAQENMNNPYKGMTFGQLTGSPQISATGTGVPSAQPLGGSVTPYTYSNPL